MVNKLISYLRGTREEVKKVSWPNKKETSQYTILVIAISLGIALFIALADYVLNLLLGLVI